MIRRNHMIPADFFGWAAAEDPNATLAKRHSTTIGVRGESALS
jgi:hypothetical protein